jgi:hypothetical protein
VPPVLRFLPSLPVKSRKREREIDGKWRRHTIDSIFNDVMMVAGYGHKRGEF